MSALEKVINGQIAKHSDNEAGLAGSGDEAHSDDDKELSEELLSAETKKWLEELVHSYSITAAVSKPSISVVPLPPPNYRQIALQQIDTCRNLYEARQKSNPAAPTLIKALRDWTDSKLPKIKSITASLDKIENELYYYVFVEGVSESALPDHESLQIVLTTPLHEAIIRGEEDIIEFLCEEYQARGLINIDSVGQNQIERPLDFYVQYIETFGTWWSEEKRIKIFKILEKHGAVAKKIPKAAQENFDKMYKGLHKLISAYLKEAKDKHVVFVVGETHASKYSALVELMLLYIAKEEFEFQQYFLETNHKRLQTYRSEPSLGFRAPQACVNFSDKIKLTVIPIDTNDALRESDLTPEVINRRDYWMTYEILKTKGHGIATVGASHLMGMAGHLPKLDFVSKDHVFCFLNATLLSSENTKNVLLKFLFDAKKVLQLPMVGVEHLTIKEMELEITAARNRFLAKYKKSNTFTPVFNAASAAMAKSTKEAHTITALAKAAAAIPATAASMATATAAISVATDSRTCTTNLATAKK